MDYLLICAAALAASGLTLFSGFGLGTVLMPVFAVFFPPAVAIAMTALVHFSNNLFKLTMFAPNADRRTVLLFGLPAFAASFLGAQVLLWLAHLTPLTSYVLAGRTFEIQPVKLVVAVLMAGFALLELRPDARTSGPDRRWLPLGGLLSGFFGGLSGNQGAFRSAFLLQSGLDKEAFIGTGVVIAVLVDLSRLTAYADMALSGEIAQEWRLILAAVLSAFLGAWLGRRFLRKMTVRFMRLLVAAMLLILAGLLGAGII